MNDSGRLSVAEVSDGLSKDFRQLVGRVGAHYRTADFASALALAQSIGAAADEINHHPDLRIGWGYVEVWVSSHDVGGITARDLRLAEHVAHIATQHGATAEPHRLVTVELGLDTPESADVAPFWAAMLGWEIDANGEIAAPPYTAPTLWWQDTDAHETPRQRWHLDIWVPADLAQQRVEAAAAAGGTLVDESHAPSFWVLEDAQGNRGCICSVADR